MPDLTTQAVHEYWKNYEDPMIYRVVSLMEAVENWTVDGNTKIENAMTELGQNLEGLTRFELENKDDYIRMMCHLRIGRLLRILQALDTTHPGAASRLLMYSEQKGQKGDVLANLFLKRNIVFERLRLLTRIFSPERMSLINKSMGY